MLPLTKYRYDIPRGLTLNWQQYSKRCLASAPVRPSGCQSWATCVGSSQCQEANEVGSPSPVPFLAAGSRPRPAGPTLRDNQVACRQSHRQSHGSTEGCSFVVLGHSSGWNLVRSDQFGAEGTGLNKQHSDIEWVEFSKQWFLKRWFQCCQWATFQGWVGKLIWTDVSSYPKSEDAPVISQSWDAIVCQNVIRDWSLDWWLDLGHGEDCYVWTVEL